MLYDLLKVIKRQVYNDKVLILARTAMNNKRVCIGGCLLSNNRYIRLLDENEQNVQEAEPYNIGEIYEVEFVNRFHLDKPHIEDVVIRNRHFVRKMSNLEFLNKVREFDLKLGCITRLFDGCLNWKEQRGFITKENIPVNGSVLITSLNYNLIKFTNNSRFSAKVNDKWHYIPYVGTNPIPESMTIEAGRLIRFSLARWWTGHGHKDKYGNLEYRSYLQISGFY